MERTYSASGQQVWAALQQTIAGLGYKDVREDPAAGTIEFRTGLSIWTWRGQQMVATVRTAGPDATVVSLGGGVALKLQATSWGEFKRIAKKVLAQVDARLAAPPAAAPPPPPPPPQA